MKFGGNVGAGVLVGTVVFVGMGVSVGCIVGVGVSVGKKVSKIPGVNTTPRRFGLIQSSRGAGVNVADSVSVGGIGVPAPTKTGLVGVNVGMKGYNT